MAKKRILVIEDDEQARLLMEEAFVGAGYGTVASPHLASLIGEAKSDRYDLITLDLGLLEIRGTDGADLLSQYTETPILVVSGNLDASSKRRLEREGVTDYVDKPFKMVDLLAKVERLVSR